MKELCRCCCQNKMGQLLKTKAWNTLVYLEDLIRIMWA